MKPAASEPQAAGKYGAGKGDSVPLSGVASLRIDGVVEVVHHSKERFYELLEDGFSVGLLIYERNSSRTSVTHAMIREDRRGLGMGTVLIASGLDHLAQSDANILVYCDAVAAFLEQNPDYKSRVSPSAKVRTPQ